MVPSDPDFETALNALAALVGDHVQVLWFSSGTLIGSSGGELADAVTLKAGTVEETVMLRITGGAIVVLERETFQGYHLHLGADAIEGVDLHVTATAEVRLTTLP